MDWNISVSNLPNKWIFLSILQVSVAALNAMPRLVPNPETYRLVSDAMPMPVPKTDRPVSNAIPTPMSIPKSNVPASILAQSRDLWASLQYHAHARDRHVVLHHRARARDQCDEPPHHAWTRATRGAFVLVSLSQSSNLAWPQVPVRTLLSTHPTLSVGPTLLLPLLTSCWGCSDQQCRTPTWIS